jgi:hypothetical protein
MLALVLVGSALLIALGLGKLFGWDIGLTAGMLAGAMTSTLYWWARVIRYGIRVWTVASFHKHSIT